MVNEHSVPMEEGPNLPAGYSTLLKRILHHEDVFRRIEGSMNAFETRLKVAEHSSNPDAQIARELSRVPNACWRFVTNPQAPTLFLMPWQQSIILSQNRIRPLISKHKAVSMTMPMSWNQYWIILI